MCIYIHPYSAPRHTVNTANWARRKWARLRARAVVQPINSQIKNIRFDFEILTKFVASWSIHNIIYLVYWYCKYYCERLKPLAARFKWHDSEISIRRLCPSWRLVICILWIFFLFRPFYTTAGGAFIGFLCRSLYLRDCTGPPPLCVRPNHRCESGLAFTSSKLLKLSYYLCIVSDRIGLAFS